MNIESAKINISYSGNLERYIDCGDDFLEYFCIIFLYRTTSIKRPHSFRFRNQIIGGNQMKKAVLMVIFSFLFGACSGKYAYIPPTQSYKTNNTVTINKPIAEVWKQIIPALGGSFFVINNLDKESGFINISYSGDPEKYVDCGIIDSYVKNARGERTYRFPASTGYKEYETLENGKNLFFIKRKMDLEGRINIIVQELSENSTLVTVNTRYLLTKDIIVSNPQNQSFHEKNSISFNTNGSSTFPAQTICFATGALEKEVLRTLGLSK